jgi:hypothetical protein
MLQITGHHLESAGDPWTSGGGHHTSLSIHWSVLQVTGHSLEATEHP